MENDRDKNRKLDEREFNNIVKEMFRIIINQYGYGTIVDDIELALRTLKPNRNDNLTIKDFSFKAHEEGKNILDIPHYADKLKTKLR